MKKASISYAKNNLSRLINVVREGGTVWITDRNVPVACLSPAERSASSGRMAELVAAGVARPASRALDARKFTARTMPKLKPKVSAVDVLLEEREAGR